METPISSETIQSPPKSSRKLVFILISLLAIITAFGAGYFAKQLLFTIPPVSNQQNISSSPTPSMQAFNPESISAVSSFYDSKSDLKKLLVVNEPVVESPGSGIMDQVIYMTDVDMSQQSAVKVANVGMSDIGQSPHYSPAIPQQVRYIAIDKFGPGDTSDVAVADENGRLVLGSVKDSIPEFKNFLIKFNKWTGGSTMQVCAIAFADDELGFAPADIDVTTGKLLQTFQRTGDQGDCKF